MAIENRDDIPLEAIQSHAIELHSINYVPEAERHGKASHLGAIWFVGNINLTAMATGVTALALGGSLMWTIVATVIGSLFGTFFMAFHSAQGPQLGLPQLVQSRPQFGYVGAAVTVWIFALVNYIAYNTSDALLSGDAMNTLFSVNATVGYFVSASVAAMIAALGRAEARVRFAGDHTCVYTGWAQGALESAHFAVAEVIAACR